MNRGAGRQRIFRNDDNRWLFLKLVGELLEIYQVETHAYCLSTNRYDLLLHTGAPNLSVAMRHLNGVYTQRFNRLNNRDGPLFRGRFSSIVLDKDDFFLPVSRHIHRKPLKTGTVQRLDRYRWSSYPSYVTRRKNPQWLKTHAVETLMEPKAYRHYVERGPVNEAVRAFYRGPGRKILGGPEFRNRLLAEFAGRDPEVPKKQQRPPGIEPERVLGAVCEHYGVGRKVLAASTRGRLNLPRLAAIWLCRKHSNLTLSELASLFAMAGYGSASSVLHRIKTKMTPAFWTDVEDIERSLATPSTEPSSKKSN